MVSSVVLTAAPAEVEPWPVLASALVKAFRAELLAFAEAVALADAAEQIFVVTAVPDEKKGERLIVLHTLADQPLEECLGKFAKCDLPPLWRPRPDQFLRIEKLPYLGTGKLDLRKARELAMETVSRA